MRTTTLLGVLLLTQSAVGQVFSGIGGKELGRTRINAAMKELVDSAIRQRIPDVADVDVVIEWEPPWDPDMMSDEARRQLDDGEPR